MNQHRAINTLAFAAIMLTIAFAQIKPETKARVSAIVQTQTARAFALLAMVRGAAPVEMQSVELARVQTVRTHVDMQREHANLACAQRVLQTKMEALEKARQMQAAARVRLVMASDSELESESESGSESQSAWQ